MSSASSMMRRMVCAAAAFGATGETAIDLAGRAPRLRLDDRADILIAQYIARTDDHGAMVLGGDLTQAGSFLTQ
ncbi:hypothetical protein J4G37_28650 [Microvirga sp. 3-52]|nr:hypothetical protein [Microvirga sp. 3-52]